MLHVASTSTRTRRRPKRPQYLTDGLFYALRSLPHSVHEREIQMSKMTKGNNKGMNYVKGTWNILVINANLNSFYRGATDLLPGRVTNPLSHRPQAEGGSERQSSERIDQ